MKSSICSLVVISFLVLLVAAPPPAGRGPLNGGSRHSMVLPIYALEKKLGALQETVGWLSSYHTMTWHLGMNLNPEDGHIMGYVTGWATGESIGSDEEALTKDYLSNQVWREPANYIAIVRHQSGVADAVKVFKFKEGESSLLSRFQDMDPGRQFVTEGGPVQESIAADAKNMDDDPIFSVGGDLAFNWGYTDNGHRIVLTGGYLSPANVNDDNTHGLGNDFACNPKTGTSTDLWWPHEVSNIQDCPYPTCKNVRVQGKDHGVGPHLKTGPVYGNYAIYVSENTGKKDGNLFPGPGNRLALKINQRLS